MPKTQALSEIAGTRRLKRSFHSEWAMPANVEPKMHAPWAMPTTFQTIGDAS
jgi:hypothetical protein